MESHCLSFQQVPHSTALFLDYLYHFDKIRRFFPCPPFARNWLKEEASRLHYDAARRERVAAILERQNRAWGASPETLDNIARFRAGASAVVTGQQVALFGGPLFSIYKALTAIRLATEFTVTRLAAGERMGAESSLNKVWWSEMDVHLHEAALKLLGDDADLEGAWLKGYEFALAGPIYAGTNEIQRNVIAERVLGLPRK